MDTPQSDSGNNLLESAFRVDICSARRTLKRHDRRVFRQRRQHRQCSNFSRIMIAVEPRDVNVNNAVLLTQECEPFSDRSSLKTVPFSRVDDEAT